MIYANPSFIQGLLTKARDATVTDWLAIEPDADGAILRLSDDPLDFVWQSNAQLMDLAERFRTAAEKV